MPAPLIGLSTYGRNDAGRHELPAEYAEAVVRAGGVPVLLPPVGGHELAAAWLDRLDGLVLTGGGDLDPALYGGQSHPSIYNLDAARDTAELALAHAALARTRPILAICRGLQVLNIALGGTLHEHVPDAMDGSTTHRKVPHSPIEHSVRIEADTRLAAILQAPQVSGISWHHQAIQRLGDGLTPAAHADDGLVEAAELPAHPWCLGVQWHPELSANNDPVQQKLFDEFVRQAGKVRKDAE